MPFGDLFKLPEGFKRPRSAPNRMEGLTFPQKLNYMGQFEGPSLMALGAGIASGKPEEGWLKMAQIQKGYQENYAGEQEENARRQETMDYLIQNGFDPSQAEAASRNPEILKHIFNLEEEKRRQVSGGRATYAPQMFKDEEGKWHLGLPRADGTVQEMIMPKGWQPTDPYTRAIEAATGTAEGKGVGEARTAFTSMQSKMPGLRSVITQLDDLANTATYTAGGQLIDAAMRQMGQEPREAAVARASYISMVDNQILPLLRDTFGAQFTVQEGETLRATLGQPDLSPAEKQVVLKNFIDQKERDLLALAVQAGIPAPAAPVAPAAAPAAAPAQPGQPAPADPLQIRPRL